MNKITFYSLSLVVVVSVGLPACADVDTVRDSQTSEINIQNAVNSSKSLKQKQESVGEKGKQNKAHPQRNGLKEGDVIYEINEERTPTIRDSKRGDAMYNEHVEEL